MVQEDGAGGGAGAADGDLAQEGAAFVGCFFGVLG